MTPLPISAGTPDEKEDTIRLYSYKRVAVAPRRQSCTLVAPEKQLLRCLSNSRLILPTESCPLPCPRNCRQCSAAQPPRAPLVTTLHDGRLPCLFLLSCSAFSNVLSLATLNRTIYFLNPGDAMLARARLPRKTHRQPPENQGLEGQSATHHLLALDIEH